MSWLMVGVLIQAARAQEVLVEAESFADHGGWQLDTQFIQIVDLPVDELLLNGLIEPLQAAV